MFDLFDSEEMKEGLGGRQEVAQFDIQKMALDLWKEANPGSKELPKVDISELSMSANQAQK
jgi:hypothetical protein